MLALVLLLSVALFGTISVSVRNAGIRRTDTTTVSTTRMAMARQPTATAPQIAAHDMEATLRWMLQNPDPVVKAAAVRLEQERRRQLEKERGPDACERVSWDRDDGRRHDVGMCLVLKNDAKILDEYIAFHWVQVGACVKA